MHLLRLLQQSATVTTAWRQCCIHTLLFLQVVGSHLGIAPSPDLLRKAYVPAGVIEPRAVLRVLTFLCLCWRLLQLVWVLVAAISRFSLPVVPLVSVSGRLEVFADSAGTPFLVGPATLSTFTAIRALSTCY